MMTKTAINFRQASKKNIKELKKSRGFTLIEVLVITSLTVLVLFSTVILLLTFLLNQARLTQKQKVKIAGDNALKQIEQAVRGARSINPCSTSMNALNFSGLSENTGTISLDSGTIASQAGTTTYQLTPDDLEAHNLNFDCYTGQDSFFITTSFSLDTGSSGEGLLDDAVGQEFRTSINLRN